MSNSIVKQLNIFKDIESNSALNESIENHQSLYLYIEGDIPPDLPEGTYVSLNRKPPLKIHSLGFQPAKSIPELPRWFLNKYAKKKLLF